MPLAPGPPCTARATCRTELRWLDTTLKALTSGAETP